MLQSKQIQEIKKLKEDGLTLKAIRKETGYSIPTIIKYLKQKPDDGAKEKTTKQIEPSTKPKIAKKIKRKSKKSTKKSLLDMGDLPATHVEPPQSPADLPDSLIPYDQKDEPFVEPREVSLQVQGIPIGKKILLTPKNVTMIQWFQARYDWDGDISDFINQCIEYFFKEGLHAKIKVEIQEEFA